MSAQAGWYPDPGGGQDLYRYWDGRAWSAATSPNPSAPAPAQGLVNAPAPASAQPLGAQPGTGTGYGSGQAYGGGHTGGSGAGPGAGYATSGAAGHAYPQYQQTARKRSPLGWWLAGAAVVVVLVVLAVVAVRAATGSGGGFSPIPGGQGSQNACPTPEENPTATPDPADGRVHGGPVSYPRLGAPWSPPEYDDRVPFGTDTKVQQITVEAEYQPRSSWVASILVAELQAGDGFFSPEQGSQVVVKCILGAFYGDAPVTSEVKVNQQATIDGHDAWVVESQLSFEIDGLQTKGELLLVAIVSAGATSGLYYASIPDTRPELVQPARDALAQLQVDG
ncbi:Protein of unknown function [Friedmanniella luteola]|uniref:DUF2510 domain-containing protein n=1 Tax=Friedmanniella luteola TaxID=546871 RepID=A0A1H1LTV4_9ACTN|nr:DUF2510 domain-containing protein [Friedmanniella luteola]SDR78054.1 Protein of unknown function [Friedmanniella luteola]